MNSGVGNLHHPTVSSATLKPSCNKSTGAKSRNADGVVVGRSRQALREQTPVSHNQPVETFSTHWKKEIRNDTIDIILNIFGRYGIGFECRTTS